MIAVLLAGCGLGAEPLQSDAWVVLEEGDPFEEHRPAEPDCAFGWWVEDEVVEVDTGLCGYLAIEQALANDLWPGERISSVFAHDALVADGPASTHAALVLGGRMVWELELAIPQADGVHPIEFSVQDPLPAGTRAVFHLHNHGANNYRLFPLERSDDSAP